MPTSDAVTTAHWGTEFLRPWKLATLAIGVGLLIVGAFYYDAPDWDVPISLIMALFAYLTAAWSLRVLIERRWRHFPAMLFATWWSVDGCYAIYWHFKNPAALAMMRDANFFASLALYGMCGLVWLYRGSLREMWAEVRDLVSRGFNRPQTRVKAEQAVRSGPFASEACTTPTRDPLFKLLHRQRVA